MPDASSRFLRTFAETRAFLLGRPSRVQLTPDGTLFREDNTYALGGISSQIATGAAAAASRRITVNELPLAARTTAENEAARKAGSCCQRCFL